MLKKIQIRSLVVLALEYFERRSLPLLFFTFFFFLQYFDLLSCILVAVLWKPPFGTAACCRHYLKAPDAFESVLCWLAPVFPQTSCHLHTREKVVCLFKYSIIL